MTKGRNLVVVRAGDQSRHRLWLSGVEAGHYDLIVSYFGDDHERFTLPLERRVRYKGGKWDGIFHLFAEDPSLISRYDRVWLPDDDVDASADVVAQMFALSRHHGLEICQPSLSVDSYFSHLPYVQSKSFELRYSSAIELMVPCLSARCLARALPLFKTTRSGFGMDGVWTRLLDENVRTSAILDSISVRHTRPVGGALHDALRRQGLKGGDEERGELFARLGRKLDSIDIYAGRLRGGRMVTSSRMLLLFMLFDYLRARPDMVERERWKYHLKRLVKTQTQGFYDMGRLDISMLF